MKYEDFLETLTDDQHKSLHDGRAFIGDPRDMSVELPRRSTMTTQATTLDSVIAGHVVSDARKESIQRAIESGADEATLATLRDALRVNRGATIVLPAHHYEGLGRGRGWARQGKGTSAIWGERTDKGYRVGVGRWIVGGNDGFRRAGEDTWTVAHVAVGEQTWTVAR